MSDSASIPASLETSVAPLPSPNVKRHLLAAALSAVVPGTGQLYLRKQMKGLVILAVLITTSLGFWPLRLPRSYSGLILLSWMLLLLSLYAVYDALFGKQAISSGRISRWWIVVAVPLHCTGVNLLFTSLLFGSGFHTAWNLGTSMQPTLMNKDRFVYDTAHHRFQPRRRGDVIIFHHRDSLFIKRIAAVGGDTIEGNEQQILLNGQPVRDNSDSRRFGPLTVARGKYFVLGDNLGMSFDSREPGFGLVDENAIVGKALYSYRFTETPLSRRLDQTGEE